MKLRISFKTPDALTEAVYEAVAQEVADEHIPDDAERESVQEEREEALREYLERKWFRYGEYVNIEVDTDKHTAEVVPIS